MAGPTIAYASISALRIAAEAGGVDNGSVVYVIDVDTFVVAYTSYVDPETLQIDPLLLQASYDTPEDAETEIPLANPDPYIEAVPGYVISVGTTVLVDDECGTTIARNIAGPSIGQSATGGLVVRSTPLENVGTDGGATADFDFSSLPDVPDIP